MLIDWFTVGVQALNFLVLVWLMRRFLYRPVLRAIDAREARIAAEIADAKSTKTEAEAERAEFQQKNAEFEEERAALFAKVSNEADLLRQKLRDESTEKAASEREKWRDSLATEQRNLRETLTRKAREEVFAISRKTLADLADSSLEEAIAKVLIRRLVELKAEDKDLLETAFSSEASPLVRSAFELQKAEREAIQQAIHRTFSTNTQLVFETSPDLIGGIELRIGGQKIAWSIAEYLTSLEESVDEILKPTVKSAA